MRKASALASLAACLCLGSGPAFAKNWLALDYRAGVGGYWVDGDTVRQSGDVTYFESSPWLSHSQTPGDATPGVPRAYNCRTATLYNVRNGVLVDAQRLTSGEAAYPYLYMLCFALRR